MTGKSGLRRVSDLDRREQPGVGSAASFRGGDMSAITERLRAAKERRAQRRAERVATRTERAQRKAQSDAIRREHKLQGGGGGGDGGGMGGTG